MHRPWLSIIMPCYNYGAFISEAIESVVCQSFDDWELIIVDDGSRDDSLKRAIEFNDQRIQVKHQQNAGVAAARNRGLSLSTGKFVAFLDADDRYLPRRAESAFEIFDQYPEIDVLISNFTRFVHLSGESLPSQFDLVPSWRSLPLNPLETRGEDAAYELTSAAVPALSALPLAFAWIQSVTIRGDLARSVEFPVGVRICEDSWYIYRVLQKARVGILDQILTELRRHGNNSFTSAQEALLPELRMFEGLATEVESGEMRRGFLAAANRSRRALGYDARQRREWYEALQWYLEALRRGPARAQAVKGLVATALRR